MIKLKFINSYSPRVKGEVVELENKLAEYYLSIGVAKVCGCGDAKAKPCSDCEKVKEVKEIVEPTKKAIKKSKK
tara:strand:- start:544 stop:765 length:222 start_codon:yes stop_codon:yes gene_type:complete